MKAISLHQPWASLCFTPREPGCRTCGDRGYVASQIGYDEDQCPDCTHEWPMVKWIETRSWPCPPAVIGQRIAICSTAKAPAAGVIDGREVTYFDGAHRLCELPDWTPQVRLPLGRVLGTAVVAKCLPIHTCTDCIEHLCTAGGGSGLLWHRPLLDPWPDGQTERDITDQLPYGYFIPGYWGWVLTDPQPCDPIPVKGRQRLWNLPDEIAKEIT